MEKVGETFQKAYFSILHKRKGVSFSKNINTFKNIEEADMQSLISFMTVVRTSGCNQVAGPNQS